ncbi:OLC1v1024410C1 [Oldenlandia corymbosa var. corymbosa]|uniref:OLC1v1024410C1 n=1 Tax=Oldenlandia corymbosa var. corymbosa TaxID=529605 RepID=A0AAV1C2N4_OLDCO|nr:OLC1v1024410C1 [Oldenlandia corymbosa var. corymbosa]
MQVPVGFLAKLWSFVSFLPFFFLLFILGSLKGILFGIIVLFIIVVGNTSVVIGLWPAHFIWTYYCVAKSKRLGWILKILVIISLPVPLIIWPFVTIIGSVLGGIGYGYFAPLIATFEAVGENVKEKLYHCFADGTVSTIKGSCTAVRDFTDFCFHSYFSYMDELSQEVPEDEKPMEIKLSRLPGSLLVSMLAIPVDVPVITGIAIWKSPFMLLKGWKRLFEDLIGREGPFLETVCVPFAGLAILLWPLAVTGSVVAAFLSSFFLALYGGLVVLQENSFKMGLAYIVAVIALFDEYTNDLLYLREGSCFPRPRYRRNMSSNPNEERRSPDRMNEREGSKHTKLVSEGSRTLKEAIHRYTPMQVWDWLFKSCEVNGRQLLQEGLIDVKDIEACIVKGKCKKLGIKLPAWSILQCLLASAHSNSSGLLIADGVELTKTNWPRDKLFEWFVGPLFVMKEQIKGLKLQEDEEICLKKLVMGFKNERPEEWDETGFPSGDHIRRAQLQAVIRRLEGIVGSLSRYPTFRRRFKNLVKVLYIEALQTGLLVEHVVEKSSNSRQSKKSVGGMGVKRAEKNQQYLPRDNLNNV